MSAIDTASKTNLLTPAKLVRFLIGAILGAAFGVSLIRLAVRLHLPVKSFSWSDLTALLLGGSFIALGCVIWLVSLNRKELARNLEGESASMPATNQEVRAVRLQAASLLFAGTMLLLPLAAMGSFASVPGTSAAVFAVILVLFILQTIANVRMWRGSDEFIRQIMLKTAAITFALCQGALFLWAAAEHLHLARPLSSWQAVMVLMTVYIFTGTYLSVRARY